MGLVTKEPLVIHCYLRRSKRIIISFSYKLIHFSKYAYVLSQICLLTTLSLIFSSCAWLHMLYQNLGNTQSRSIISFPFPWNWGGLGDCLGEFNVAEICWVTSKVRS